MLTYVICEMIEMQFLTHIFRYHVILKNNLSYYVFFAAIFVYLLIIATDIEVPLHKTS